MHLLEQHLSRSSGTFELFSPSIEFVVRELTAGVELAENRQRLLIVPAGSGWGALDDVERDGDEEPHPERSPQRPTAPPESPNRRSSYRRRGVNLHS